MREDQLFGVVAGVALLIWLVGRGMIADPRRRRQAEAVALGLVAAGILFALIRTVALVHRLIRMRSAERADAEQPGMQPEQHDVERPAPAPPATSRSRPGAASGGAREWRRTGRFEVACRNTPQPGAFSRVRRASIRNVPASARTARLPKKISEACVAVGRQVEQGPQGDAPHERVARDADRCPTAGDAASGSGRWPTTVGLGDVTAQTTRRKASGIRAAARWRSAGPASQSGTTGAARHAITSQTSATSARSE